MSESPHQPIPPADVVAPWVALSLIPGLGMRLITRLLQHFGSLDAVLAASGPELRAVSGIGPALSAAIEAIDLARTASDIAIWQAAGIRLALHAAPAATEYPVWLQATADAPPVLFMRGSLIPADARAVAIVGTRQPLPAQHDQASAIAGTFATLGWTIVSGLAAGIDTAAHLGALQAGGRTLAVLGNGVRTIYPPQNAPLATRIESEERGALLAEVHPAATPNGPALVSRNRIISGLSRAVIVVASSTSSGTRHAARFAAQQSRPVYALANDSPGNQALIADGALPLPSDFAAWDQLAATWDVPMRPNSTFA